jgi:TonB-dependent receptor
MKLKKLYLILVAFSCALAIRAQDENAPALAGNATAGEPAVSVIPATAIPDNATAVIEGRVSNMSDQKYLTNARVSIEGTIHEDLTDEYGAYRFSNLPAGTYKLSAFFTGLEPREITVTITTPGERVVQDFELASRALMDAMRDVGEGQGPRTKEEELVFLEKFSVVASREMAGNIIATNEQRFATNIKSVIETDAFGDMNAGNAAEFLKYMPGVSVGYDGIEANSVSVRGFGSAFTNVTSDGAALASAASGDNESRAFNFEQISINEIALIEVSKVPLPSMSAGSLGGSINMVSKSAFESKRTTFRFSAGYSFNSKNLDFMRKTPGPYYEDTYKQLPGGTFALTMPVTRNFGIVVGAKISNQYTEQNQSRTSWNFQENALDRLDLQKDPYLQVYQIQARPKQIERDTFSVRADWRMGGVHVFSLSYSIGYNDSLSGKRNMNWDISEESQLDESGVYSPREWGWSPDWGYYTISPENYIDSRDRVRGENFTKQNVGGIRDRGVLNDVLFKYRFTGNQWDFDAFAKYSISKKWKRSGSEGYFANATTQLIDRAAGRVGFFNINGSNAPEIKSFAVRTQEEIDAGFRFGEEMDVFDLNNYNINSVQLDTEDSEDIIKNLQFNVRRVFGGLPYFASIKAGGDYYIKDRDTTRGKNRMSFLPNTEAYADLTALGYKKAVNYIDEGYSTVNAGYGLPTFDWISPQKLYQVYQANPTWFAPTGNNARDNLRDEYRGSKELLEGVTAFYVQLDGRFFQNRLVVVTGVRWEMTDFRGHGAYEPTEGDTADDILANWAKRGAYAHRTYNDFYPSLHLNYNITENLITRFAYARTLGRPDFDEIIPTVKIRDKLDETGDGDPYTSQIEASNPNLEPYTADNLDFTIEYYMPNGGEIRLAGYYKRIDGLFVETTRRATMEDLVRLNIGSEFYRVPLIQKINLDEMTKVYGVELECRLPLAFFGRWGKAFDLTFNYTRGRLEGDYRADFGEFTEEMGNVMLSYRLSKLRLSVNCNYQGLKRGSAQTGDEYQRDAEGSVDEVPFAGFYEYEAPTWRIEANMEYRFSKSFAFYITAKNINSPTREKMCYNPVSAAYAPYSKSYSSEIYGTQFTFGVKGSF